MLEKVIIVSALVNQFSENALIGEIAQYAEDKFKIPKQEAVNIIVDTIIREV